jgi:hypothetical protein
MVSLLLIVPPIIKNLCLRSGNADATAKAA